MERLRRPQPRWRRPYRLGSDIWLRVPQLALLPVMIAYLTLTRPPAAVAMIFLLAAIGSAIDAVRGFWYGIYLSDAGVRSRSARGTTQVAWAQVAGFRTASATMLGIEMGREAIYLDLLDGTSVQTSVLCRLRFGQVDRLPHFGRIRYWPDEYDEILAVLQAAWRQRQTIQQRPPTGVSGRLAPSPRTPARTAPVAVQPAGPRARPAWHRAAAELANERQVLARKHRRGELTDDEYTAALARLPEP